MPNFTKTRRNYKKLSAKQQKRLSLFFIFSFLMLFFLLIINFSDIFSTILTHKGSLFSPTKIEVPSFSVYGVSVKDFDNDKDAQEYALSISKKGASNFVYVSGEHFVLCNAYQSLNEAKEIKANLDELGYNARIVNLKVDAISKNYKGKNLALFTSSINFFRNCYNNLYEEGLNFDKKLSNINQVNSIIAKDLTILSNLIKDLKAIKNDSLNLKEILLNNLEQAKVMLEEILVLRGDNTSYSSTLKTTSIKIIILNKNLVKNINEL